MPFFLMKKIKNMVKIFGFLLAVFIVAGCVAQKNQVQTVELKSAQEKMSGETDIIAGGRQISNVRVEIQDQLIEILIQGNQKLVYTSIKQSFPFGIAIYLPQTVIAHDFKTIMPENKSISDVVVAYADAEKTTAKIEILLNKDFNYDVIENDTALKIALLGSTGENEKGLIETLEPLSVVGKKEMENNGPDGKAVIISKKTATMTDIEFNTMEDGKSNIVVKTNHPVKYDISSEDSNTLYLNLHNTIIPDYHKRALLTHYFKSAVKSLLPVQVPGKKKFSRIEIKIRDQVPYRIVRNENIISMFFDPSSIEPPVFSKAKKQVSSDTLTLTEKAPEKEISNFSSILKIADTKTTLEEEIFGKQKVYTGEKIKLDFYETDIKNVFRILRSVGGLNFAIDKNVEGKVTLTLENAVPWDQVLDLVLKMNNLGMKQEGNVIRIATMDTIKKEERILQETIAARKKSLEQKKSFEPLVTEYIPINYSDADADMKPHIVQILTKGRGKISVDKRTNMIILTDVQSKIDHAREIIYRLDKVTPQIMIEAKVVEVTKNFSRELGIGLSLTERNTATAGVSDFTVALNSPLSSPVTTGSFNFFRLFGSSLTSLNAQLAASETRGDVKVVSSPRILTLDNKTAKIKQGLEYAYLEKDDAGGSSVKFKNIDLMLEVTPHVTPDKRIGMKIYVTKNDVDSVSATGVPSLSTNEAETELLVNNNETIVIGGIVKTTDNKSTSGTPFLSGIPLLGRLFRTDRNTDNRTELLIFITPSIVQLEQKRNTFTTID